MSGSKFFQTLPRSSRLAAWGVAGGIFLAWQYYETKRDNSLQVDAQEIAQHNAKSKEKTYTNKNTK